MAFTKLHHVGMMVRDLKEARHLFCDVFGQSADLQGATHPCPVAGSRA